MDVFAVASSVVIITSLVANIARLVAKVHDHVKDDADLAALHWQIWTEQKKTSIWAASMRQTATTIPSETRKDVELIRHTLDLTSEKVARLMRQLARSENNTARKEIKRRALLLLGDRYEELRSLVRLMSKLNEALAIAAPPIPPYQRTMSAPIEPVRSSSVTAQIQQPHQIAEDIEVRLPCTSLSGGQAVLPQTPVSPAQKDGDSLEIGNLLSTIQMLFSLCTRVASSMIKNSPSAFDNLVSIEDRLIVWQDGIFNGKQSLQRLFKNPDPGDDHIANILLSLFVDIAFAQEQILTRWVERGSTKKDILEDTKSELTAVLSQPSLLLATLQRWESATLEKEQQEEETMSDCDEDDQKYILELVDLLYDALPTIREIRKHKMMRDEALANSRSVRNTTEVALGGASPAAHGIDTLVKQNLYKAKQLEDLFTLSLEDPSPEPEIVIVSKAFSKTVERLERWKVDVAGHQRVMTDSEGKEVQKVQTSLHRALERFFDSDGEPHLHPLTGRGNMSPSKSEKHIEHGMRAQGDVQDLLKTCTEAVNHLYLATNVPEV